MSVSKMKEQQLIFITYFSFLHFSWSLIKSSHRMHLMSSVPCQCFSCIWNIDPPRNFCLKISCLEISFILQRLTINFPLSPLSCDILGLTSWNHVPPESLKHSHFFLCIAIVYECAFRSVDFIFFPLKWPTQCLV